MTTLPAPQKQFRTTSAELNSGAASLAFPPSILEHLSLQRDRLKAWFQAAFKPEEASAVMTYSFAGKEIPEPRGRIPGTVAERLEWQAILKIQAPCMEKLRKLFPPLYHFISGEGWERKANIIRAAWTLPKGLEPDANAFYERLGPRETAYYLDEIGLIGGVNRPHVRAIYASLESNLCPNCGGFKNMRQSLCCECFSALNTPRGKALYQTGTAYIDAWISALRYLNPKLSLI